MKKLKFLVAAELIACTSIGGYIVAAEDVYELNPVVVTAERTEKKDLEIPAAVQVITAKEIKEQGYTSVADALGHTVDVGAYSYTSDGMIWEDPRAVSISVDLIRGHWYWSMELLLIS